MIRLLAFLFAVVPAVAADTAIVLYVEADGDDRSDGSNSGKEALRTLAGARDRIRALTGRTASRDTKINLRGGAAFAGVTVFFGNGTYYFPEAIAFDERDSGTDAHPIVYRAAEGAAVKWTGAYQVPDSAWALASATPGPAFDALPDHVAKDVYRLNVAALGIEQGGLSCGSTQNDTLRLISGDSIMKMSRWPEGDDREAAAWVKIKSWTNDPDTIVIDSDEPSSWRVSGQAIRIQGCYTNAWTARWSEPTALAAIEGGGGNDTRVSLEIRGKIGASLTRFLCFRNALETLDQPGDYVWNPEDGLLYFLPPGSGAPASTSLTHQDTIIRMGVKDAPSRATHHVTFQDMVWEGTRNGLFKSFGPDGLTLDTISVRNIGGPMGALVIEDSTNLTISGGGVYDAACMAAWLHGGVKSTLTDGHMRISNWTVDNIGWDAQQNILYAVQLKKEGLPDHQGAGVGVTMNRVTMRNCRDAPLGVGSANALFEDCIFDRNMTMMGDAGIGCGFSLTNRPVTFRRCVFRNHRRLGDGQPRVAGPLDSGTEDLQHQAAGALFVLYIDTNAGWTVEDCTFENNDQALIISGNKDLLVRRNRFIKSGLGHHRRPIALGRRDDALNAPTGKVTLGDLDFVPLDAPPWSSKYPDLVEYRRGGKRYPALLFPEHIVIKDNIVADGDGLIDIHPKAVSGIAGIVSWGIDLTQLNYPVGASGTPVDGGGTVPLRTGAKID